MVVAWTTRLIALGECGRTAATKGMRYRPDYRGLCNLGVAIRHLGWIAALPVRFGPTPSSPPFRASGDPTAAAPSARRPQPPLTAAAANRDERNNVHGSYT